MARTEAAIRNAIIGALSTSSMLTTLGLNSAESILDRNIDLYLPELRAEKLYTTLVSGQKKRIRAWAVEVFFSEQPRATGNINIRNYNINVIAYYEPEDVNTMLEHSRKVVNAIRLLGHNISSTLASISSGSISEPSLVETDDDDIDKYVTMTLSWEGYDDIAEY